jgi:imidazolonepropionase-like amidohydrolase
LKTIRDAFDIARSYWHARKTPAPDFKSDLRWEALMPIFDGKLPLFVHADTLAQIESALAWAKQAQLKIVLVGGIDAWRMAPQLRESDTPVIITRATTLPLRRDDAYDSAFANAARLAEAGVRFCLATKGRESEAPHERSLPYEAAMARRLACRATRRSSADALPGTDARHRGATGLAGNRQSGHADRDQR